MQPERLYLRDIIEAEEAISEHPGDIGADAIVGARAVRAVVLHELAVIGEAAGGISQGPRDRYPDVPWTDNVAFQNFVVHEYFGAS